MKDQQPQSNRVSPLPFTQPITLGDATGEKITGLWIKAILCMGLSVFIGLKMGMNWIVDIEDPDFNPVTFLVLGLGGYGLIAAIQALWAMAKRKTFGNCVLQLSGDGVAKLGEAVEGVVRTQRPLTGAGHATLTLLCIESHAFRDVDNSLRQHAHDFIVWESAQEVVLAGLDAVKEGIPFQFHPPAKVGTAAKPSKPSNPYFKGKFALNIPGMKKRIFTSGETPMATTWRLELQASTPRGRLHVLFNIPMQRP